MTDAPAIPPISRVLAVVLFAALCCLVVAVFVTGYVERSTTRAAIDDDRRVIAEFDARLSAAGGTTAAEADDVSAWIQAPTGAVAAASIQTLVGNMITSGQGTVREVQVVEPDHAPAARQPGLEPVAVEFFFETTHAELRRILMDIAASSRILETDALSIQALPEEPGVGAEVTLRVDLKITGYWVKVGA